MPRSLDLVVTSVATQLMAVNAANSAQVSQQVLADLVTYFDVDVSFLRHNDHDDPRLAADRRVAAAPRASPTPIRSAIIYFADADPVFALAEHGKKPTCSAPTRPPTSTSAHRGGRRHPPSRWRVRRWCPVTSPPGVLGFVKFGDREWKPEELNALEAIASLFAQVQARIAAEEQLRYLAEHDDLTGLHNRRALLANSTGGSQRDSRDPCRRCSSTWTGSRRSTTTSATARGDRFIRVLAERLREAPAAADLIARLGGDEFVVVPPTPLEADRRRGAGQQLQSMLRERVAIDGEMLTRTVSIGVALGIPGRDTTSDLLRKADQAVPHRQERGRQQGRGVLRGHVAEERVPQRHRASPAERHRDRRPGAALPARGRHAHR